LISGGITFYGYYSENKREISQQRLALENSRAQLYAQSLSSRQTADANLREAFLNILMKDFFAESEISKTLLKFELIAVNYRETIHLKPLFEYLERKLRKESYELDQLHAMANSYKNQELKGLREKGAVLVTLYLRPEESNYFNIGDTSLSSHSHLVKLGGQVYIDTTNTSEKITLIEIDSKQSHRLIFTLLSASENSIKLKVAINDNESAVFPVNYYDMPRTDNFQFGKLRCSVVLMDLNAEASEALVRVAFFPEDYFDITDRYLIDRLIGNILTSGSND